MPSTTCPSCSARIRFDEADRPPTKCPECGAKLSASPRSSSKPSGPPPTPSRKQSDDDDRPARRNRASDDDEREDRSPPSRRRSRDDDDDRDRPPKKKSKLPLVLGVLGVVLLLGCAGCGGVLYYFYSKGKDIVNEQSFAVNVELLREGMTQNEVETMMGQPGTKLTPADFTAMTASSDNKTLQYINDEHIKYWKPWVDKGLVYRWQSKSGKTYALVAYNNPPESGGKLKGLSFQVPMAGQPNGTVHNEKFKLPRNPSADDDAVRLGIATRAGGTATKATESKPPKTGSSPGDSKENPIRVTVDELLANPRKHMFKWLTVSGLVADISLSPTGDGAYLLTPNGMPAERAVRCIFGRTTFTQAIEACRGDNFEATGRWIRGEPNEAVELTDCQVVNTKRNVTQLTATDITREYSRDAAAADKKYSGKWIRITGQVLETKPQTPGDGITLRGLTSVKAKTTAKVSAPCSTSWKNRFEAKRVGEAVIVFGEVIGYADGVLKLGDCWLMTK